MQSSFSAIAQPERCTGKPKVAQSKLTDYVCTAKVEHIILFENGSWSCMNSINLKIILLNAQPSGARAENSAKLIQVLCDRCTASVERLST